MPQQYIDFAYVKEHASFEPVLSHYSVKLVGKGTQRSVLCPFHRERSPSCKIELERKIFHCFGCGEKGNLLEFVAKLEDADLRTAAEKTAAICGIDLAPPRQSEQKQTRSRGRTKAASTRPSKTTRRAPAPRAEPAKPDEPVNPPLTFTLKLDPEHPYLKARGLSAAQVEKFGLGYCSRGLMAGRICVPIHDATGALVAYAGRWAEDEPPDGTERYLLPPKFEKSRVLFNLHRLGDVRHVVLVEGYWSVFRLHALGIPAVSLMGWSISEAQIALLRERGTEFVTALLDGDEAGTRARERIVPSLAGSFFVRAPVLPDGEKPDTLAEPLLHEFTALPERTR